MIRYLLLWLAAVAFPAFGQQSNPLSPIQGSDAIQAATTDAEIVVTEQNLDAIAEALETIANNSAPDQTAEQNEQMRHDESIQLAQQDLKSQQTMANFTRLIYLVTAIGVVVGIVTIIFLGYSISQTRQIIRQDRAWISVSTREVRQLFLDPNTKLLVSVTQSFPIENVGKTPALNLCAFAGEIRMTPTDADYEAALARMRSHPRHTLAPKSEMHLPISFSDTSLDEIMSGAAISIIFICSEYDTIYGEKFLLQETCKATVTLSPSGNGERILSFAPCVGRNSIVQLNPKTLQPKRSFMQA